MDFFTTRIRARRLRAAAFFRTCVRTGWLCAAAFFTASFGAAFFAAGLGIRTWRPIRFTARLVLRLGIRGARETQGGEHGQEELSFHHAA
jgi:hypothetical protein